MWVSIIHIFQQQDNHCSRKFVSSNYNVGTYITILISFAEYLLDSWLYIRSFVFHIIYYYYCLHAYCIVSLRFGLVGSLNGVAHESGTGSLSPCTWRSINKIWNTEPADGIESKRQENNITHMYQLYCYAGDCGNNRVDDKIIIYTEIV